MFPTKLRKTIRGCQAHINAGLGCGLDTVASVGTELFAPFDGKLETYYGNQGGNWARITRINGDVIEMAHLSKYVVKSGNVKAGQLIAYTGNTGSVTTGPHLHIQIIRDGKRLDPETYNWEDGITQEEIKELYRKVWKREPAPGDWMYFQKRLEMGTIKDYNDLKAKMSYTYSQFKKNGDAWWQAEKRKVLGMK